MRKLAPFLTAALGAIAISTTAIVSVQNATPISLNFLTLRSVRIPFGTLLAFGGGTGAIAGALLVKPSEPLNRWERWEDD